MRQPARWLIVTTAGAITAVLVTAVVALAASPTTTKDNGSDITSFKTKGLHGSVTTESTSFEDLQSGSIDITVSGDDALLVARFTAESKCDRPGNALTTSSSCIVRIVVDDGITETVMNPAGEITFDSTVGCAAPEDSFCDPVGGSASHAAQRFLRVEPGDYTVRVQFRVTAGLMTFTLGDYMLSVERVE